MSLDHSNIKQHSLDLSVLQYPSQIYEYFKKNRIRQYAYSFTHGVEVLKHGESAEPGRDRDWGERARRQSENIPGWGKRYKSDSGKGIVDVLEDYRAETGITLTKKDVTLIVYDFNAHITTCGRSLEEEIKIFEAEKIDEYKSKFGKKPVGNAKDESHQLEKTAADEVKKAIFSWA